MSFFAPPRKFRLVGFCFCISATSALTNTRDLLFSSKSVINRFSRSKRKRSFWKSLRKVECFVLRLCEALLRFCTQTGKRKPNMIDLRLFFGVPFTNGRRWYWEWFNQSQWSFGLVVNDDSHVRLASGTVWLWNVLLPFSFFSNWHLFMQERPIFLHERQMLSALRDFCKFNGIWSSPLSFLFLTVRF